LLDWEIESYPDWGTWTFDPDGGEDLTPEDGAVTVEVEVIWPNPENVTGGEVVLANSENPEDICIIDILLVTPISYQAQLYQFLERFQNGFPILRYILDVWNKMFI